MNEDLQDLSVDIEQLKEACRKSIDYMAALAAPHIYLFAFPVYYRAIFQLLSEAMQRPRDFSKFALGFPRGFAKSTFLKFIVMWAIFFTKKKNIVIICANVDPLAKNFMADMALMLDHTNILRIFGNWRINAIKVTQTDLEFRYNSRLIKITAVGVGTSVRGMVRDGSRPDFIILDDIQTRDDANSEQVSAQLLDWLYGTINFLRSPFGCTYVFLANMYPTPHSLLKKLIVDPEWQTFVASGITDSGESLWEELHPLEQLLSDFRSLKSQGKEDIFYAEIMNMGEINTSLNFTSEKLLILEEHDLQYHQGAFVIIDPSGRKKKSDDTAIGGFKMLDGIPFSVAIVNEVLTPKQTILKSLDMAAEIGASLICAEDVAYQETLLFWFEEYLKTHPYLKINLAGINPGGVSKNARIIDSIKSSQEKEIGFTHNTASVFVNQALGFNPLISNNKDDVLDIHAYATKVVQQHGDLIAIESPFADAPPEIPLLTEQENSPA
jgi:hypothetical protein